jgi:ankyrin repeat protein
MVKLLLRHGADVNARDRLNWTPLHYAAFTGTNPRAILLLLRSGADTAAENSDGRTPAMVARYNRRPQDIVLLIEKPVKTKQQKPGY